MMSAYSLGFLNKIGFRTPAAPPPVRPAQKAPIRSEAEAKLRQAKLRLEAFIAAARIMLDRADGKSTPPVDQLPPEVRHWIQELEAREGGLFPRAD